MKPEEYVATVVYDGKMINVGIDDAGQTYFLEYLQDDKLIEECIGPYVVDYMDYIQWRFTDSVDANKCDYYNQVNLEVGCDRCDKPFCCNCDRYLSIEEEIARQERRRATEEWLNKKR